MTSALPYLGIAAAIIFVGVLVVTLVHSSRNVSPRNAADEFQQVMNALAPDERHVPQRTPRAQASSVVNDDEPGSDTRGS